MGIRRLLQNVNESVKLEISDRCALLVFELEGTLECIHLIDVSIDELRKLERFHNPKKIKFFGSKTMLVNIEQMRFEWEAFEKKVLIDKSTEVLYDSRVGTVNFANKKKVLIIDDSKTIQKLLKHIIEDSDILSCMGVADDPIIAREMIEKEKPDLITLDMHMPNMTGLEFLKTYLGAQNIPTVMITSLGMNEGTDVIEALSCGADSYIQKPAADKIGEEKKEIIEKLESLANSNINKKPLRNIVKGSTFNSFDGLIAIGSSTGGTKALEHVFTSLPDKIPPIVVVQHIPAVFSKALADRLDKMCDFKVKEGEDGELLCQNTIYIAPGDRHMKITERSGAKYITLSNDPPVNRFKPSVDYLFSNLSTFKDINMIGVLLTGMGRDGANGLLELKRQGAFTIAQDEESSVVFGMPKEAISLGAQKQIVSLDNMACAIVGAFNNKNQ